MKKNLYVITGCDTGIGKTCAELLMKNGHEVAISYLKSNPFGDEPLCHAVRMDITKEKDIEGFARSITKLCRKGYSPACLFSNSGIALGGPVEDTPLEIFRSVMEVNFFGTVSLIQKFIPLMRESKGMVMINGSLAGRIALPFMAPYSSSKFAIEGFADSLRRELNPFGISTVLIEPAAVATPIWTNAKNADRSYVSATYMESADIFMEKFVDSGSRGMPVEKAAEKIVRIMFSAKPKPRYLITGTGINSLLQIMIPDRTMDRLLKKLFRMDYS